MYKRKGDALVLAIGVAVIFIIGFVIIGVAGYRAGKLSASGTTVVEYVSDSYPVEIRVPEPVLVRVEVPVIVERYPRKHHRSHRSHVTDSIADALNEQERISLTGD